MAEQNMLSFAGGLGLAGYRPFLHTFGVFLYRRPYDQLMASIAYPRRKVRLMGFSARRNNARRHDSPGHRRYFRYALHSEYDNP